MRAYLDNMFRQIKEYFGAMDRKVKIRLGILAVLVVVLAIVAVSLLSRTNYVTLYTAQSTAEAGRIYEALQEMGEPATVEGTRILVPEAKVNELRVVLAAQGIIDSDAIDYSFLEGAAAFNVTDAQAKKMYEAQAEVKIKTAILKYEKIQNAVVIVNFGEYSPFVVSQGVRDATANITLVVQGGAMLLPQEAQAIAASVKGSIPGIKDENIAITDSKLNHYPVGEGTIDLSTEMNSRIGLKNLLQQQIKMQCEQLLMPIFGVNNLEVSANVVLNFDRRVTEWVEFDPPIPGEVDGIVRSSSELYENSRRDGAAGGIPGTDTNAMGTVEYPYVTLEDGEEYRRAVIERNYEINETREILEHEQGKVEALSIAVSVNKDVITEDYTAEVANLVSKGLGVHPDNIAVEQIPFPFRVSFEDMQAEWEAAAALARRKEILQTVLMWLVILLLGLAFISLIKMIVRAVRGPEPEEPALVDGGIDYMVDDDFSDIEEYEDVELNKKSSALEQIERFIDKDAVSVAQLLRNWLTDD